MNTLEESLEQVEENANKEWMEAARKVVVYVASKKGLFTTDDVWHFLGLYYPHATTHEPRAMGAVMREAAFKGICEPTEFTKKSVRMASHRRPVRVWAPKGMQAAPKEDVVSEAVKASAKKAAKILALSVPEANIIYPEMKPFLKWAEAL